MLPFEPPHSWSAMDPKVIDELARRLAAAVPESVSALGRDLEQNFKSVLQAGLAKLDLVTRTEFDVQAGVLKRTREMLEALDQRLRELEAELARKAKR
jgi:BMFP domain-containing protein YqiC